MQKDRWFSLPNILHDLFEITILIKGINGIWEIVAGFLFFFLKTRTIYRAMIFFVGGPIFGHSAHFATNYLAHQVHSFSTGTKYFLAAYFLFYGLVNIFLVICLLKQKHWAYPAAVVLFSLFILYQCYRLALYHSGLLLVFTLYDVVLVILTWLEYKRVMKKKQDLPNVPK